MGIVIKQGFWGLSIVYIGVVLGYLSTLIILPAFLEVNEIGLIQLVQSNGLMLAPVAALGIPNTWLQIFPRYSNDTDQKNQAFTFSILFVLLCNILLMCGISVFSDPIRAYFAAKSALYNDYILISIFIFVAQSFFETFTSISQSQLNATIPAYFKEIHLRLTTLLIVVCYGIGLLSLNQLLYGVGLNYLLTSLIFSLIISHKNHLKLQWPSSFFIPKNLKVTVGLATYFGLIAIGGSIVQYSGQLITSKELGLEFNGILTTCIFIAAVIEMPRRVIGQITTPLVSSYLDSKESIQLNHLNRKVSLNMLLITSLIFLIISFCLSDLFNTIPKGESFEKGFYVVIVIGLGKVMGMFFGMSSEIFMYSKLKKWNILILVISSIYTIIASVIFIRAFGIIGAAIAFTSNLLINHIVRTFWIRRILKVSPFSLSQLKVSIPIAATVAFMFAIPLELNPYANMILKSLLICSVYLPICYLLGISEEINQIISKSLLFLRNRFK